MRFVAAAALLLQAGAFALPSQLPFTSPDRLTTLSRTDFETFSHSAFEDHSLRVREPKGLCDPAVAQKSGYLDVGSRHFYFWSFESRNDPKNDPVVLWLNGGPGCSSFTGLLQELGPCRVGPIGQDPTYNPYSWNNNATLIFLDQPTGVGYSYSDKSDKGVWSTHAAAIDVYAFLHIWFEAFADKFGTNDFHISGESYAGRYIPSFAEYIILQDAERVKSEESWKPLNLASILVGNGFTNPGIQYGAYRSVACGNLTGYGPFITPEKCDRMEKTLPRCQALVDKCAKTLSAVTCLAANTYCEKTQTEDYYETGRNPYDVRKFGVYAEEEQIGYYLNRDDVRHELGVDMEVNGGVKKFIGCSDTVGYRFASTGDQAKPTYPSVVTVVENNVAALFYSGKADFICNWPGNNEWTLALNWTGQADFNAKELKPWYANEAARKEQKQAGTYRVSGNLAFAIVDESGHFVPYDKPVESLAMFNNWIFKKNLESA